MNARLRQLVRRDLKSIIIDHVDYDLPEITEETDIKKDLGFDSLDFVELLIKLESQYEILIPDEDFEAIRTFDDLYRLVENIICYPSTKASS